MKVSDYNRVFVIGDIHGWNEPLQILLDQIKPTPADRLITLGDYVDRGPDNPQVLDTLIALYNAGLLIPLRGNHDQGMMEASYSMEQLWSWKNGLQGDTTLRSYGITSDTLTEFKEKVPKEHIHFLRNCLLNYFELDDFICVHAGVNPRVFMEDQQIYDLHWKRFHEHVFPHISGKVMLCGHSAVSFIPAIDEFGRAVCVDTRMGAHENGWLTAVELNTGNYIQVNRDGEVRSHQLLKWPI